MAQSDPFVRISHTAPVTLIAKRAGLSAPVHHHLLHMLLMSFSIEHSLPVSFDAFY